MARKVRTDPAQISGLRSKKVQPQEMCFFLTSTFIEPAIVLPNSLAVLWHLRIEQRN
jgi:hypothetical protein